MLSTSLKVVAGGKWASTRRLPGIVSRRRYSTKADEAPDVDAMRTKYEQLASNIKANTDAIKGATLKVLNVRV